jgi:hypothetical protein
MAYPPISPAFWAAVKAMQGAKSAPAQNGGWTRTDGTKKGMGFLGLVKRPDGKVSSEISITSGDVIPGKETLIPTLVPTLTHPEVQHLLSGKYNPQAREGLDDIISMKAIDFARQRVAAKKPFFALPEEEGQFKPTPRPVPAYIQPKMAQLPLVQFSVPQPKPIILTQP